MALQRQLKALGIFARLKLEHDRDTHLADVEPVLAHAMSVASRYRELSALAAWLEELAPKVHAALGALSGKAS